VVLIEGSTVYLLFDRLNDHIDFEGRFRGGLNGKFYLLHVDKMNLSFKDTRLLPYMDTFYFSKGYSHNPL